MNKVTCYILEDEPMARALLEKYVENIPNLILQGSSASAVSSIEFLKASPVDVVFIDIQMPDLTGIEVMDILPETTRFVITSAYNQYALESYNYNVVDYLVKPISFQRFYKSVEKTKQMIYNNIVVEPADNAEVDSKVVELQQSKILFVKTDGKLVKINLQELLFIEGLGDYLKLHLSDETLIILSTITNFMEKLPKGMFVRVHKSYVVQLVKIQTIEGNRLFIGKSIIPIGVTYKEAFFQSMDKFI